MALSKNAELQILLQFPAEKPTVEYKSWLNLSENSGKATLAKAAIGLANEGGGIIVLGMSEDSSQGGALDSQPRPATLGRYNQDVVNAAINRHADPQFHCELAFATHLGTSVEHAFVLVPGGMTVPVMKRRDCQGIIAAHRCYVRKPGPKTEEPFTAEEWRGVMERCLAARRESMLDAIRVIVQGHGTLAPAPALESALLQFEASAIERWTGLLQDLPADDDARMPLGHYEISFAILDVPSAGTAGELRRRIGTASIVKHTGWGPFVQLTRPEFEPRVVDGNVEVWIGQPVEDRVKRDSAHCDYWRAHPSGLFFLLRGYVEDVSNRVQPGSIIDITLPIWHVGEALLYASRIARAYGENPEIIVRCRYIRLKNRRLGFIDQLRDFYMTEGYVSHDNEAKLSTRATAAEIDDNLVEILHSLLVPLYERFGFFALTAELVRQEIAKLRGNRF